MTGDNEYNHETRVKRLENAVRRHGAVHSIKDWRDHGDEVYLDVVFEQTSVPDGFADEFNAEMVSAWVTSTRNGYLRGKLLRRTTTRQAAVFRLPIAMEKEVTR